MCFFPNRVNTPRDETAARQAHFRANIETEK